MPMTSFYELPNEGEDAFIYVHFIVREDAHLLYGFTSKEAKLIFKELLKLNGVGPKMALAILSTLTPSELVNVINTNKVTDLVKVPGVGKKTAERIVLELRDKSAALTALLQTQYVPSEFDLVGNGNDNGSTLTDGRTLDEEQAILALVALGYKQQIAENYIDTVAKSHPGLKTEDLIREALKNK